MTPYEPPELDSAPLKAWRKSVLAQVLALLPQLPALTVSVDAERDRYRYQTIDGARVSLTRRAGIYVLYSRRTDRPVYVAECNHIKREVNREFRPTGASRFKNQWVRAWLDLPRNRPMTRDEAHRVAGFVQTQLYLKCFALAFGRLEIATDLKLTYRLRTGPNAIDPQAEFEVS